MRTSIITRSVVAVASLAIGSAALTAAPATAATPSGITRDMVRTAVAGVRATPPSGSGLGNYGSAANRALKGIVNRACAIDPEGPESLFGIIADATDPGSAAEGLAVTAVLYSTDGSSGSFSPDRVCTFGVLTTTAGRSVLTGTATISGSASAALSRDVYVTPATRTIFGSGSPDTATIFPAFSATGNAVQSNQVKIADKKTSKEKRAAKKKYAKRLAAAKKSYKKALAKAGGSKSKKAVAKKAYKAKRASAKAKYRYAIASYKLVTRSTRTPFTVSAQVTPAP